MQADRELLEKAAKAAGLRLFVWGRKWAENFTLKNEDGSPGNRWNPLADDGDALRLAVKLGLFFKPEFHHFLSLERFSGQERDDCRAHRRAIVRAAAALCDEKESSDEQ